MLLFVTFWGCLGFFVAVWGFWHFLGLRLFLFCWFAGAFAVLVWVLAGACGCACVRWVGCDLGVILVSA